MKVLGAAPVAPDKVVAFLRLLDGVDAGHGVVVVDADAGDGSGKGGAIGVGQEEDGFGYMVDVGVGEAGVIFGQVDDGVFAGNVGG